MSPLELGGWGWLCVAEICESYGKWQRNQNATKPMKRVTEKKKRTVYVFTNEKLLLGSLIGDLEKTTQKRNIKVSLAMKTS